MIIKLDKYKIRRIDMNISFINEEKQYRKLFLAGIVNGIGDRFSSVAVLAMLLHLCPEFAMHALIPFL